MKKAALYARVSSKEQAEEGVSIPAQIKQLKQYAVENGFKITHEFVDRGESARTADRPEFQKMITLAKQKSKPFDAILIHKTDRFARNREDSIIYKSLLRKQCGIDVISITEKFDDSPQGKMLEGIMEVVAEFYSANLAKEVMKGMNEQAEHGIALGEPPYGYTIDKDTGKFAIYEPEARVVRYVFQEYLNGGSLRSIGMDLRKNGTALFGEAALKKHSKAVKNEGKHTSQDLSWRPNTVRRVLRNEVYIGHFKWNDKLIKDNHEAIITKTDYDLVQDILDKRKTKRRSSKDYLLRGLVSCYECGGSLSQLTSHYTTKAGEKRIYRRLRCSNHVRMGNCYYNYHKMSDIENELSNFLKKVAAGLLDFNDLSVRQTENKPLTKKYNQLKLKLEGFDDQFDKLMEAFQGGVIDLNQLKKYKTKLENEKQELQEELNQLCTKIENQAYDQKLFYTKLKKVISTLDDEQVTLQQKQNALTSMIDELQISEKKDLMKVLFKI